MCRHFDTATRRCREERAEDVTDRQTANFCDWFSASDRAFLASENRGPSAELKALFGDAEDAEGETVSPPKNPLDDLFK